MMWHTSASQTDLLALFSQETRFESQINGKTQESMTTGKQLERPPEPMPLQMSALLLKSPQELKENALLQKWKLNKET